MIEDGVQRLSVCLLTAWKTIQSETSRGNARDVSATENGYEPITLGFSISSTRTMVSHR